MIERAEAGERLTRAQVKEIVEKAVAAAMASYAKQADDETLSNYSKRIKARAI